MYAAHTTEPTPCFETKENLGFLRGVTPPFATGENPGLAATRGERFAVVRPNRSPGLGTGGGNRDKRIGSEALRTRSKAFETHCCRPFTTFQNA